MLGWHLRSGTRQGHPLAWQALRFLFPHPRPSCPPPMDPPGCRLFLAFPPTPSPRAPGLLLCPLSPSPNVGLDLCATAGPGGMGMAQVSCVTAARARRGLSPHEGDLRADGSRSALEQEVGVAQQSPGSGVLPGTSGTSRNQGAPGVGLVPRDRDGDQSCGEGQGSSGWVPVGKTDR